MELFRLFGTIGLNGVEEIQRDIEETTDQAEQSEPRMTNAFKKIGTAVATYFAVDKIVDFGKSIVDASATVSAEASAFEQIMGDYSDEAQKKMQEVADTTGVVDTRLTGHMTSMTAKFKGLGYGIDDATTMASEGLLLASDASAFWDKSLEDSMGALNSFINGSYEGGEAIGLFANDTQLASWAVKNGIVGETKEWANLEEARKQATRLEYAKEMMEMSGATGQASKEAEQYANVQANLTEKWRQFKAQIGEPLLQNVVLPTMDKLSGVVDKLSQGYEDLTKWISENKDTVQIAVGIFASATAGLIAYKGAMMAMAIVKTVTKWLDGMTLSQKLLNIAMSMNPIGLVTAGITTLVAGFIYLWNTSEEFRNFWINMWNTISTTVSNVWNSITSSISSAWENIKNIVQVGLLFLQQLITLFIDILLIPWNFIWQNFGTYLTSAWENIKNIVSTGINFVKNIISIVLNVIENIVSTVWNSISALTSNVFNTIGNTMSNIWNSIKSTISRGVNGIESTVAYAWNGISSVTSSVFNAIKSKATSVWNGIKSAIETPINNAKNAVKSAIDKMKSFFNFSWSLPKLKLPHVSIKGEFSLMPPKVPTFGIDWYAKGGILNEPTVFGINGNNLMVGGEAGAEAIAPIDTLMSYVRQAVKEENTKANNTVTSYIQKLIDMLATYMPQVVDGLDRPIVLDDGTLVSRLAQPMDEMLGEINKGRGRGR